MNYSLISLFPGKWVIFYHLLFFPITWFLWTVKGDGIELFAKILFLCLPAAFLCGVVVLSVLSLITVIFRPKRSLFVATLLVAWWDAGKSILYFWAGIFKFIFFSIGWLGGAIRILIYGLAQTIKDVIFLPVNIIYNMLKGYAAPGIPWVAVMITIIWIILESTVFSFILNPVIIDIMSALSGAVIPKSVGLIGSFFFLFMFIGGSFACMHGLVEAIEQKRTLTILKMLLLEFFVMFIEVMFLYREFVSSLAPFFAQMTNDSFQMNIYHIMTISMGAWFGVRAGIWFFFAKYGTPTLLMIISRKGINADKNANQVKVLGGPLLWIKEIVVQLREEIDWFEEKGYEIINSFMLPPLQIFASMTNFVMIFLTGKNLFNLPIKDVREIKDTKRLIETIHSGDQDE